jgi:putative heme-binding domain-containing protein
MILGQGGVLGPDLSNAGAARTVHQLRESMAKPSARIAPGFRAATAATRAGRKLEGVVKNYNNYTVQIVDKTGRLHLLDRADLASFEVSNQSLMPPVADPAKLNQLLVFLAQQSTRSHEGGSQ